MDQCPQSVSGQHFYYYYFFLQKIPHTCIHFVLYTYKVPTEEF